MKNNKQKSVKISINKVYTRTGDKGVTGLIGGKRISKSDPRIHAYGTIDELNSVVGSCVIQLKRAGLSVDEIDELTGILFQIQQDLFNLGTMLAIHPDDNRAGLPGIGYQHTDVLENHIDNYNRDLPNLNSFVLPGGSEASVWFHLARTVCRRAERYCISLSESALVEENILKYLNRLSDAFFVWGRWINHKTGENEILWKPTKHEGISEHNIFVKLLK